MARAKLQTHFVSSATFLLIESILFVALSAATAVSLQAQAPQAEDQKKSGGDESWTTSSEANTPNTTPSRTTDSHTKSGNRTVDKHKVDVLGTNGGYQPSFETETETVQVDASTTRTVVRTYRWNANGQRTLAQVTEEESRTTAGGDARTERKTSNADVNGNFQLVRREVAETKKVSPNAEETKSTIYGPDGYGGLAQSEQTQEVKTHNADDSVAVKSTTRVPDGNGSWKVSDVTEKTIKDDGKDRTTEERVSRPDLEGRLYETSRTVSKEAETPTGEKKSTVENYSVFAPGYSDGGLHLNRRVTTTQKKDSGGEITEQQIEQLSATNPSDAPKVTQKTKYVVQYAGPGTQQTTRTVELRDASGNYNVVETQNSTQVQAPSPTQVETQKPTQAPPKQKSEAPSDKP